MLGVWLVLRKKEKIYCFCFCLGGRGNVLWQRRSRGKDREKKEEFLPGRAAVGVDRLVDGLLKVFQLDPLALVREAEFFENDDDFGGVGGDV